MEVYVLASVCCQIYGWSDPAESSAPGTKFPTRDPPIGPRPHPLRFNRGMGPKIQGFISGLFSTVYIDRLCMMTTLSPGLKHYGEITADMNL